MSTHTLPGEEARALAKPLFWRPGTDHPQDADAGWVADGISGRYTAEKQRDGTWLLWWAHDNFIWEKCATFAECKEKAEADWQRRFAERLAGPSPCSIENGGFLGPVSSERVQEAFAHQPPSRAAGEGDPLSSYEKFDGVGPHAETIETRARIGESYLEAYESALTDPLIAGYTPADCPSELLLDLLERLRAATPPVTGNDELTGREGK